MQAQLVLFGKDGDGAFAHFIGCAHHADGDFAAVGDQDLGKVSHVWSRSYLFGRVDRRTIRIRISVVLGRTGMLTLTSAVWR